MKFYIETYGCQMNKYDSALVGSLLSADGHIQVTDFKEADLILVNTCSVREHAEKRALGRIAYLSGVKKRRPQVLVGVIGCMAARYKQELLELNPRINFVVGPQDFHSIPEIVREYPKGDYSSEGIVRCSGEGFTANGIYPQSSQVSAGSRISSFISIMRGCNNFCTYCIVPYLRGRESYRSTDDIIKEANLAVSDGVKEITLLGQNVNSWQDGELTLPDLLEELSQIEGLKRIRFITNHPKDVSPRLIKVMAQNSAVCKAIHLPAQSGSTRILKLMSRGYSRQDYLRLTNSLKEAMPNICITTDIIIGFPSETEKDFEDTIELVKQVGFDGVFTFYYSPRPFTRASQLKDQLSHKVKIKRLNKLIEIANSVVRRRSQRFIGNTEDVLVEGEAKKNPGCFTGRNEGGKVVIFPKKEDIKPGDIVPVKIKKASVWVLFGTVYEEIKAT